MTANASSTALTCPKEYPRRVVIEGRISVRNAIEVEVPAGVNVSRKPVRLPGENNNSGSSSSNQRNNDDFDGRVGSFEAYIEVNARRLIAGRLESKAHLIEFRRHD